LATKVIQNTINFAEKPSNFNKFGVSTKMVQGQYRFVTEVRLAMVANN